MPEDSFWLELLSNRLVSSIALVAILITLRILAVRVIRGREEILSDYRRAWLARIRNVAVILTLLGLALIWLPSLHAFALSITAFAVALVIATKELILCLSGTVLRIVNQPFEIGDWVEIGDLRGQVVDETMLATTLQEIGGAVGRFEYSGKTIVVPNSIFLTTPIQNQNFFKKWVYLEVCVVLEPNVDMRSELPALEEEVASLHAPHSELAQRYSEVIRKRSGIDIADPRPRVTLSTTDIGKQRIGVTLFCPTPSAFDMEHAINDAVLRRYWHLRNVTNASAPA